MAASKPAAPTKKKPAAPGASAKTLGHHARAGRVEKLTALLTKKREELDPKALDDALVEACLGLHGDCMRVAMQGLHTFEIVMRAEGLSAGFVRWMILSAVGGTRVRTGAGMEATLRVVAIDAKGSLGGSRMDRSALSAWAEEGAAPSVWQAPLPFELSLQKGSAAEIVVAREDPEDPESAFPMTLVHAMEAWTALLGRMPKRAGRDGLFALMAIPGPMKNGVVRLPMANLFQEKGAAFGLPCSAEDALAQLGQVMRAVHERAPLTKVTLSLPG
jgi:hypothetical protein